MSSAVISMLPILEKYQKIRGKSKTKDNFEFWDIVVLSTADEEQKKAYEIQINNKVEKKELPLDVLYRVISDPPGPKVGNGGSIMHCLHLLSKEFPEDLYKWRVLILPAGGQSQRLPSASVLGKVFTALPLGDPMYQMLDLQLALFLPFLSKMQPGVFVAAPDVITTFNLKEEDDNWSFMQSGFTVLAHPGTIEIGKGHGVYVVENPQSLGNSTAEFARCLEVLQKPTEALMREKGAVVKRAAANSGDSCDELVYVDSVFFFDHEISQKLVAFYEQISPLTCEIDGYGDFLQSVGPRASIEFTNNDVNVSSVHPDLKPTRQKVFNVLKGTPINLIMLNESRFNHIGSTKEYLHHYCMDPVFSREMSLNRHVLVSFYSSNETKRPRIDLEGCVLHSKLHDKSALSQTSITEYCDIDVCLHLQDNCILSNCQYLSEEAGESLTHLKIPPGTFLHTVPVTVKGGRQMYVTVVFGVNDNLKKKVDREKIKELPFLGQDIEKALSVMQEKCISDIFPENKPCGLWFAKLFPAAATMTASFSLSLQLLLFVKENSEMPDFKQHECFSMHDVLDMKDVSRMIKYRNDLHKKL